MSWVLLSLLLVREDQFRDRLINMLLLVATAVALGFALFWFGYYTIPAYDNPNDLPFARVGPMFVAKHILVILALTAAALFLSFRLFKRRPSHPASSVETPQLVSGSTS